MIAQDLFSADTTNLPTCQPAQVVPLSDGDAFDLCVAPVVKQLGNAAVRMLAYNGSIPGPSLRVEQGSQITVNVTNQGDVDATVHWHGLRLDNRFDGTHQTQHPIPVGGSFAARVVFPDPGIYWYHPHIRQDYGQEMGLYGTVVVTPTDPEYWPPAHREVILTLDDILVEDGKVAPFSRSQTTHTAMGRFGDVLLIGGDPDLELTALTGEVVRMWLINTANTRVFNVAVPAARMKLVGGDSGRVEREQFVDRVLLAPSERVVVDVLFDKPGQVMLEHRTPDRTYALATITVTAEPAVPTLNEAFNSLRINADMIAERQRMTRYLDAAPDKTLAFVAEMNIDDPDVGVGDAVVYVCPMHPEVVRQHAGRCPKCGMKLLPAHLAGQPAAHHGGGGGPTEHTAQAHQPRGDDDRHEDDGVRGIEWEDDMVEVNKITTPANMRWMLIDRATGAENAAIQWRFRVGDQVKIRLVNEMDSDHPMHHPFHVHGAGRFLIMSRDGVVDPNLVWKDTVLVRTGETVDILLDVTNPGLWMAHCHIAEHHESGMMFSFRVDPAPEQLQ